MKLLIGKWYIGIMISNRLTGNRMPDDLYMGVGNLSKQRMIEGRA